jgi:deoxyribonuclease-1
MKLLVALFIALFSMASLAQQDQKLPDGRWSYYGEDFYLTLGKKKSFDRAILSKIFNGNHTQIKGALDTVQAECPANQTCYRHVSVGYDRARIIMFGDLDKQIDDQGTYVTDVYCGKKFYFKTPEEVYRMSSQVNIEHTWPQSRFNGSFSREMQKSDMHHLYPSDSHANSVRGNSPFGFVSNKEDAMGGEGCRSSRVAFINNANIYTPPKNHRGNVARALFYFSVHYNLPIDHAQELILKEWHKMDPVDSGEIERHEKIAQYQKVRNPFVDHPQLVDLIADF